MHHEFTKLQYVTVVTAQFVMHSHALILHNVDVKELYRLDSGIFPMKQFPAESQITMLSRASDQGANVLSVRYAAFIYALVTG